MALQINNLQLKWGRLGPFQHLTTIEPQLKHRAQQFLFTTLLFPSIELEHPFLVESSTKRKMLY